MATAELIQEKEEQEQEHLGGGRFNRLLGVVFVAVAMVGGVALALGVQSSGSSQVPLPRNWRTTQAEQHETQIQPDRHRPGTSFRALAVLPVSGPSNRRISASLRRSRSPPPKRAMERKPENRVTRPRESLSQVPFDCGYPRPHGMLMNV